MQPTHALLPTVTPPSLPMTITRLFGCLGIALLGGCGGGSSSSGSAAEMGAVINGSGAPPAQTAQSEDNVNLVELWDKQVRNGYQRAGEITTFWSKTLSNQSLSIEFVGLNADRTATLLRIQHPAHGARVGDSVTLAGIGQPLKDLPKDKINQRFTLLESTENSYLIAVPQVSSATGSVNVNAALTYRYQECTGRQEVRQDPATLLNPPPRVNNTVALRATHVADTVLKDCSPTTSRLTTYKYFADRGPQATAVLQYPLLGQEIVGGDYSTVEGTFELPSGALRSGQSGTLADIQSFTDRTRNIKNGRTTLQYRVLPHTSNSVFLELVATTFDSNQRESVRVTDYYGKDPAAADSRYGLIGSQVLYNNLRRNEVVVNYTRSGIEKAPALYSGQGTLRGTPPGTQNWTFFPIDVKDYPNGGEMTIVIRLGQGRSAASYDLFYNNTPALTADGRPRDSLVNAYDVPPGAVTTLRYRFPAGGPDTYYLGIEGNWFSSTTDENTFTYDVWIQ